MEPMVRPQRAAVVPRVLSEISGDPFPIDEMLLPHLGKAGLVALLGPFGAGKTTALGHLAASMPDCLLLFDEDTPLEIVEEAARASLVVYAGEEPCFRTHTARLRLAPWGRDEALDYLMAAHPARCGAVMRLLAADPDVKKLEGTAELWRAVLDRLAQGSPGVAAALAAIATRAPRDDRILLHRVVLHARQAYEVAVSVRTKGDAAALRSPLPLAVIRGAERLLAGDAAAREFLATLCAGPADDRQPMAASLLLALDPAWRPGAAPRLASAHLAGAKWRGADLRGAALAAADLAGADLDAAVLDRADAAQASFRGASLRGAHLRGTNLSGAYLRYADLAGAVLARAHLFGASLLDAKLPGADLAEAVLLKAQVAGADLSGANLSGATCRGLDLRAARLDGANFSAANLRECHLDGVRLRAARFDHADLFGACLTGSELPRACFRDARLRDVKVADVRWEGADLRGADLTGAIFHLGSSRSGLVESFLASEGTRTGFYTDEFDEQHFKAPEAIRKADLKGADLRGARVLDTDFYLVDLRGALYDEEQERHFRRCRAILRTKTP